MREKLGIVKVNIVHFLSGSFGVSKRKILPLKRMLGISEGEGGGGGVCEGM